MEKIKKIDSKNFELKKTITTEEVVSYNLDVVNETIRSAEENVERRESELESAKKELNYWKDIKSKLK